MTIAIYSDNHIKKLTVEIELVVCNAYGQIALLHRIKDCKIENTRTYESMQFIRIKLITVRPRYAE